MQGQILAIRPDVGEGLNKHGDIKNFMPGMTMPFKVRDTALLQGKAAGDLVTAQLMVGKRRVACRARQDRVRSIGRDRPFASGGVRHGPQARRLLSVSVDPDRDTPAALEMHAEKLGAIPNFWYFATAPPNVIDRFAAAFGVNVIREHDGTITHNLRTVVVAPDGRIERIYDGSDWTPESIVEDLRRALAGS